MIEDRPEDVLLSDARLTLDRLIRSLYQNKDGLLCTNEKNHKTAIDDNHNALCLYVYYKEAKEEAYYLDVFYVYVAYPPESYAEWVQAAHESTDRLNAHPPDGFFGVYGWTTTVIKVTPIRTDDMLIAVDKQGARGVRISFDTRRKNGKTYRGKKN